MPRYTDRAARLLAKADVEINGSRPWDPQFDDPEAFFRTLPSGRTLFAARQYMDRTWSCKDLEEMLFRVFRARLQGEYEKEGWLELGSLFLLSYIINPQSILRSRRVGKEHYDLGNQFYKLMLSNSDYSAANWEGIEPAGDPDKLPEAQALKKRRFFANMHLKGGERVLDIGCGWGDAMAFAVEKCGVSEAVGFTISEEQYHGCVKRWAHLGNKMKFYFADYREVDPHELGKFDCVGSIGMGEHVGEKNFRGYMRFASQCLRPGGTFAYHSIFGSGRPDGFYNTYIFPGGSLPRESVVIEAARSNRLVLEDYENFGHDYYLTCTAWKANCVRHRAAMEAVSGEMMIRMCGSFDRFWRMWADMYLDSARAGFRSRRFSVGRMVFVKGGTIGGWRRPLR